MNYAYIQLHAPDPPQRPRLDREERERINPYPDYEQSYIIEDQDGDEQSLEDSHVVIIEL